MRRFRGHVIGIDQGSMVLFSDFEDGGVMWTGHGPRAMRREVIFPTAFQSSPVVHVSLSMWDLDNRNNMRADISAEQVTPQGFTMVFRTWGDTRVARVRADWLAIGEQRSDEDWEVD